MYCVWLFSKNSRDQQSTLWLKILTVCLIKKKLANPAAGFCYKHRSTNNSSRNEANTTDSHRVGKDHFSTQYQNLIKPCASALMPAWSLLINSTYSHLNS